MLMSVSLLARERGEPKLEHRTYVHLRDRLSVRGYLQLDRCHGSVKRASKPRGKINFLILFCDY